VSKILFLFSIIIFFLSCSLDKVTGIWTQKEKIEKEIEKEKIVKEIFTEENAFKNELNANLKIKIKSKPRRGSYANPLDNNTGYVSYNGNLKSISKYKFSKIKNFNDTNPELVFDKDNIIFYEKKGTILKFNNKSKLTWKKNFYSKREKKLQPTLSLANNSKILVVADSIAKYYAMNLKTGDLIWSKKNTSSFNSEIKIFEDKFFVIDFENILHCYSLKNGNEIWNVKTDDTFIKSQKRLSLIIIDHKIYFSNSVGDISAVDIDTGDLLWQTPTQGNLTFEDTFFLKISDLVGDNHSIYLSNNKNDFFSLDIKSGALNWKQKVNSNIRPTIIDDFIFTVSNEGFFVILDSKTGSIIRITDIFKKFTVKLLLEKNPIRAKFKPIGFIVGLNNLYLTTTNGKLFIVDILTGNTQSILKIDRKEKISRPFLLNQNLFIIKDNSIIKLN